MVYEGKKFSLTSGDRVFIDCQNSYNHTTDPENLWRLKWIHFYGPTMGEVYKKYKERGGRPVFKPESNEEIEIAWSSLMTVAGSHDYMRDMLINQHLSSLLTLIM